MQPNENVRHQGVASFGADLTLEQADFDHFAEVSGDHNPIHVDPTYAASSRFGATVSHGMLLYSRLRGLIEHCYPGADIESEELVFPAPAFAGELLDMQISVIAPPVNNRLELRTLILREDDQACLEGHCWLQLHPEKIS